MPDRLIVLRRGARRAPAALWSCWLWACGPGAPEPPPGLSVHLDPSDQKYTGIEVVCDSGFRHHEDVVASAVHFDPFPTPGPCKLVFKGGGPPSDWGPAPAGGAIRCTFDPVGEGYSRVAGCAGDTEPTGPEAPGADLVLDVVGEVDFNSAEVECPSGYVVQHDLDAPPVTFAAVPDEECVITFRGRGAPRKVRPVRGGQHLACTFADKRSPVCTPADGGPAATTVE